MKSAYLLIALMITLLMSGPARAVNDEACPKLTINREVAQAAGIAYTAIELHQGGQDGGGALW
jgi:hypothetical protein